MTLCACGCGRPTQVAPRSDRGKGWIKGQSLRFAMGHNSNSGTGKPRGTSTPGAVPCACGCGQIAPMSRTGRQLRYVSSHNSRITRKGYVRHRVAGESQQEHVMVAERALGKPLPKGAQVHHVDENKRNNTPSNLVICQDQQYHYLLHKRARVVRAGGDPNTQRFCLRCECLKVLEAFAPSRETECRECTAARYSAWLATKNAAAIVTCHRCKARVKQADAVVIEVEWADGGQAGTEEIEVCQRCAGREAKTA